MVIILGRMAMAGLIERPKVNCVYYWGCLLELLGMFGKTTGDNIKNIGTYTVPMFFGWAIRFRTRTKTTKMSCATITP